MKLPYEHDGPLYEKFSLHLSFKIFIKKKHEMDLLGDRYHICLWAVALILVPQNSM